MEQAQAAPEAAFGQFGDEYVKNSKKHYYASVTFVDEQVGRIIRALKDKGMYDDAVICFVSDHGDMMGDHNHWRKTYAYEGSAAIPFIVKLPESIYGEQGKGTVSDLPVELRDVLPTFLDAAGGTVPEDMDGMSLLPLIKGKNTEWRRWIDLEHAECYSQDNYWCALTDGKIKYIRFLRSGREQLFDLTADPAESTDLSADRRYRKELEELRKAMAEHLSKRGEGWVKDGKPVDKLICGSGRKGNIDLTIFDHNGKPACIIEFKARNDGEFSHGKDLFKLANESDWPIRFFVEIYAKTDNATVVSIRRKLYKNKYFNIADNTEYLGFSLCHKGSESGYCFFIDNQSDILPKNNI